MRYVVLTWRVFYSFVFVKALGRASIETFDVKARHFIFCARWSRPSGERGAEESDSCVKAKNVLRGLGIVLCIALPICYVGAAIGASKIPGHIVGVSYVTALAACCLVLSLAAGHILVCMFWRSFRARDLEKDATVQDHPRKPISSTELSLIHNFLEKTFAGSLRIIPDYRFPNGYRADAVAVRGRGNYPMMCVEMIDGEDGTRKVDAAVKELYQAYSERVPFMRCFVLRRFKDGRYELLEVRRPNEYRMVGIFDPALREAMEEEVDRAVNEAKKRKVFYPILFLLLVVTPMVESVLTLSCMKVPIASQTGVMVVVWIGSFLGIFGVGIKGYEPTVSDLMGQNT